MNRQVDVKALISHIVRGDGVDKCRICLGDTTEGRVFLGDTVMMHGDKAVTLAELLETITGVEVETSAILPNRMCRECINHVMNFVPFIQLCLESMRYWKSIVIYLKDMDVPKKARSLYVIANKSLNTYTCTKRTKTVKDALRNLGCNVNVKRNRKNHAKNSTRSDGKRMICPECNSCFNSVIKFNNHIKNISKKICVHCNTILDLKAYGQHLKTHQLTTFPCNLCPEVFSKGSSLDGHMSKHKENHVCVECKETFATESNLAAHMFKHKSVVCSGCDRKFSNKICYNRHGRNCGDIKENSTVYVCDYCKKEYRMRNALKLHIIFNHMAGKQYQCDKCGKRFVSRVHLEEHDNTHNKVTDRYLCITCGSKFSSRRGYERHIKKHQIGREGVKKLKYKCPICLKVYNQKKSVENHLKIKHDVINISLI